MKTLEGMTKYVHELYEELGEYEMMGERVEMLDHERRLVTEVRMICGTYLDAELARSESDE